MGEHGKDVPTLVRKSMPSPFPAFGKMTCAPAETVCRSRTCGRLLGERVSASQGDNSASPNE